MTTVVASAAPTQRAAKARTVSLRQHAGSVRIARRMEGRMEGLMRTQAMIPGHVVKIAKSGVTVRVRRNGRLVSRPYAPTQVFFFTGSDMLDAASARGRLRKGAFVMVPERSGRMV